LDAEGLSQDNTHLRLFPTMSGYRDDKDQALELTAVYVRSAELIKLAFESGLTPDARSEIRNLNVVICREEIVSATLFHESLYNQFAGDREFSRRKLQRDEQRAQEVGEA
jgi:hypothetical protein